MAPSIVAEKVMDLSSCPGLRKELDAAVACQTSTLGAAESSFTLDVNGSKVTKPGAAKNVHQATSSLNITAFDTLPDGLETPADTPTPIPIPSLPPVNFESLLPNLKSTKLKVDKWANIDLHDQKQVEAMIDEAVADMGKRHKVKSVNVDKEIGQELRKLRSQPSRQLNCLSLKTTEDQIEDNIIKNLTP
jgi:hypothetical protein